MPQGVIVVFKAIGVYLAKHAVVKFFVYVAASVLLQKITEKLFGPGAEKTSFAGIQTTSRGSLDYRKFVYGKAMVGGTIFYNNVRGTSNEWLDFNIAYVDHEIEELVSFLLDNDTITAAQITWTPPTTNGNSGSGNGDVTLAKFIGEDSENALRISWYPGHSNQPANTNLTGEYGDIGSNHRARGIFHAHFAMKYKSGFSDLANEVIEYR